MVGFLIRSDSWEEVQLNLKAPFSTPAGATEREVDVSGQRHAWDHVCIIECKAEKGDKELDAGYVDKFFSETVPSFLKLKCPTQNPSSCRAEIWTTGIIGTKAKKAFEDLKLKPFVKARLVDRSTIENELPKSLKSTKKLIETIAAM